MRKLTIADLPLRGARVFVRVDFNVPFDEGGAIADDTRIRESLPTLRHIIDRGGIAIAASHLGRPKGKPVPRYSLAPVATHLATLLGTPVTFLPDCVGPEVEAAVRQLAPGSVACLENLRFHPEEEANDPAFARRLAALADIYCNDAFGTAHRAHASIAGVPQAFDRPCAGLLLAREIENLSVVLEAPAHPFYAVIGGAKVSDKLGVIDNLLGRVDRVLLGGGLIFSFYKAQGLEIGASLVEESALENARRLLGEPRVELPTDVIVAPGLDAEAEARSVPCRAMPAADKGLDIGPQTIESYRQRIAGARTLVWCGPMGVFEKPAFAGGTRAIAAAVAAATRAGAHSVVGGGDTVAALTRLGFAGQVTHASTGGGACLEFLEGRSLPGIAALKDA